MPLADGNPRKRQNATTSWDHWRAMLLNPHYDFSMSERQRLAKALANPRKRQTITKQEEWELTQRMIGALVGKYGARLSEETEEQARILIFVTLAGLGIEVER